MIKRLFILICLFLLPLSSWATETDNPFWFGGTISAGSGTENIGYTAAGGTIAAAVDDYMFCTKADSLTTHNGTAVSITYTAFTDNAGGKNIQLSIYNDDGGTSCYDGSSCPSTVVANSPTGDILVPNAKTDITYTYTGTKPVIVTGTRYWVCESTQYSIGNMAHYYDTTGGYIALKAITYGSFPDWAGAETQGYNDRHFGKAFFVNGY